MRPERVCINCKKKLKPHKDTNKLYCSECDKYYGPGEYDTELRQ